MNIKAALFSFVFLAMPFFAYAEKVVELNNGFYMDEEYVWYDYNNTILDIPEAVQLSLYYVLIDEIEPKYINIVKERQQKYEDDIVFIYNNRNYSVNQINASLQALESEYLADLNSIENNYEKEKATYESLINEQTSLLVRASQSSNNGILYRFYSEKYKGHFYTTSLAERNALISYDPNWTYEGVSYKVETSDNTEATPVYRFYSDNFKGHFYTINKDEATNLEINDPNWDYEGEAYHVFSESSNDRTAVYRFWSDTYKHHFFTASEDEKDSIIKNDKNWAYEGVAWYIEK